MRVQAISTLIMLNFLLNPEKKISYIYLPIYFYKNKWGIGGYFYKKIIFYFNNHLCELRKSIIS